MSGIHMAIFDSLEGFILQINRILESIIGANVTEWDTAQWTENSLESVIDRGSYILSIFLVVRHNMRKMRKNIEWVGKDSFKKGEKSFWLSWIGIKCLKYILLLYFIENIPGTSQIYNVDNRYTLQYSRDQGTFDLFKKR